MGVLGIEKSPKVSRGCIYSGIRRVGSWTSPLQHQHQHQNQQLRRTTRINNTTQPTINDKHCNQLYDNHLALQSTKLESTPLHQTTTHLRTTTEHSNHARQIPHARLPLPRRLGLNRLVHDRQPRPVRLLFPPSSLHCPSTNANTICSRLKYGTGAANKVKARFDTFNRTAYDSRDGQKWMK